MIYIRTEELHLPHNELRHVATGVGGSKKKKKK